MPRKFRGKTIAFLGITYTLGCIFACMCAIFTLDSLTSGNWNLLLSLAAIPALLTWLISTFFLDESPRHELVIKNYDSAISILEKMYKENKPSKASEELMTKEEKELLAQPYRESRENQKGTGSPLELFRGKNLRITSIVWINWLVNVFTYNGVAFILPLVLSELNNNSSILSEEKYKVSSVIYSCLTELPTVFVTLSIIDLKYLKRKNSMTLSFLVGGILCFLAALDLHPGLVFWISVSNFFLSLAYSLNYVYTAESYPTKSRVTGLGMAAAFGNVGAIAMPAVCSCLISIHPLLPFPLFSVMAILAGMLTFLGLKDTSATKIDEVDLT